ncbi:hypothetical protein MK388_05770 [Streptococcus salivarius]|nr:hypothetical protein [Streptococcus salivarius]
MGLNPSTDDENEEDSTLRNGLFLQY